MYSADAEVSTDATTEAFSAGVAARQREAKLIDNPYYYSADTDARDEWERGWKQEHWRIVRAEIAEEGA